MYGSRIFKFCIIVNLLSCQVLAQQVQTCVTSSKRQGYCTLVENCSNLIEEYFFRLQSTPLTFEAFLRAISCEVNTEIVKICCPTRSSPKISETLQILGQTSASTGQSNPVPPAANQPGISIFSFSALNYNAATAMPDDSIIVPLSIIGNAPPTLTTQRPVLPTVPNNNKLQPGAIPKSSLQQCGSNAVAQTRIVGGYEAKKGSYPWMAALAYLVKNGPEIEYLCGGSLITTRHVLTAAHCINNDLTLVRLGAFNLSQKEAGAVDVKIARKFQHEQYNSNTNANDIGMLRLDRDITVSDLIIPICLPYNYVRDVDGTSMWIAGWGAQRFRGPTNSVLRAAQLETVSVAECKRNYSTKFSSIVIDDKFVCAGGGQVDSCQGDSGGPLMLTQFDPAKVFYYYNLIGIVSFGYECAVVGLPGVYTRVSSHLHWIEDKVKL